MTIKGTMTGREVIRSLCEKTNIVLKIRGVIQHRGSGLDVKLNQMRQKLLWVMMHDTKLGYDCIDILTVLKEDESTTDSFWIPL